MERVRAAGAAALRNKTCCFLLITCYLFGDELFVNNDSEGAEGEGRRIWWCEKQKLLSSSDVLF